MDFPLPLPEPCKVFGKRKWEVGRRFSSPLVRRRFGQKVADDREAQAGSKAVGLRLSSIWLAGPTSASGARKPMRGDGRPRWAFFAGRRRPSNNLHRHSSGDWTEERQTFEQLFFGIPAKAI